VKEKEEIRGAICGPPRDMIECGLARVISYKDLPFDKDTGDSWQREAMRAGRQTFTEMIPQEEPQPHTQTVQEIAETATAQAIEVEPGLPGASQAAA
jgi:antitoxin component of RelBE/YafQ-DinJ toxin-antitoxin module